MLQLVLVLHHTLAAVEVRSSLAARGVVGVNKVRLESAVLAEQVGPSGEGQAVGILAGVEVTIQEEVVAQAIALGRTQLTTVVSTLVKDGCQSKLEIMFVASGQEPHQCLTICRSL